MSGLQRNAARGSRGWGGGREGGRDVERASGNEMEVGSQEGLVVTRWKNTGKQERCNVQCLDDVPCLPEQEEDI